MAGETILIVDDEVNIRKAMSAALEREGYRIVEAREGREALQSIFRNRPELVLLDIMLPGMNGYDVTIKLRDDSRTRDLPIIMVTAKGQTTDRIHGLDLGADDYITKPFDLRELVARVNAMMRRKVAEVKPSSPSLPVEDVFTSLPTPPPDMTFESFIVGPANREAHEAAVAVAKAPGVVHNPLFVYGEAGIGKSHLIAALANKISREFGPNRVAYASSELFEESIREAILTHTVDRLSVRYGQLILLAVDDLQFLSRTRSQQDRTLEVFMDLYDSARQVVVCSDRPPERLNELADMMRSLFVKGRAVKLDVPTPYHRGRILRAVAQRNGWNIPESSLIYLARNLTANVRTLIGVAKRLAAEATLTGKPISPEIIDDVIAQVRSMGLPRQQ